ncbi:MAG: beta-ketoacyl-ACP synthase II [Oligoflexales bacterium]|nr:beta-ketoacyl-ACP synthase II [Oligoflexales bacterium]
MTRVVVTGLGIVSPTGNNVADSWRNTLAAESGIDLITLFDTSAVPIKIAGEVKNFSSAHVMDLKESRRSTRFVQMAVVAAKEALDDAGLQLDKIDRKTFGVSIGAGIGGIQDIADNAVAMHLHGYKRVSPFLIPYSIPNMAAGMVSMNFGLSGPNICPTTACTSGTHGIGEAFLLIKSGMAKCMIAGGAESAIGSLSITAFGNMKALCAEYETPSTASRPFDLNRCGFVMGEGAGLLVLEEYDHAVKRGAKIYAEMIGYGMSGDAYHITSPAPEGEGAKRCMQMAMETAKIKPEQVDYINAHGTSTKLNDHFETLAIMGAFGEHAQKLSISSTKGVTGHCLGAAGGIEAVYTIKALEDQLVPPTAHLTTPDPECPLDYTPLKSRSREIKYAMSNSFGFGGTNGTILFKKFEN